MKRFVSLLFAWFSLCAFAAQQPDARTILDRTSDAFRKAGGIQAKFEVRTSAGISYGSICLKGEKFLLEAEGIATWFDGRTQWSYLASSDEVNVSEPTVQELQSIHPYAWLALYKNGYEAELGEMDNPRDSSLYYKVMLQSTDKVQDVQAVILQVSKTTYRPVRIEMRQRGGEAVDIRIASFQPGLSWPDNFFVFDSAKYPSAEVIDMR